MTTQFTHTRAPSVKIEVGTRTRGATSADNTVVIIGRMAAAGTTGTAGVLYTIENFGDEVKVAEELEPLFGRDSEIYDMAVAAVKANKYSNASPKVYPRLQVLPMANGDSDLATLLANNMTVPMPFVAVWFSGTDTTLRDTLRGHLNAISASDRGKVGQFGSFGYVGLDDTLATVTPHGIAAASEKIVMPYLRDTSGTKANKVYEIAAGLAAVSAASPTPFNPINEIVVGGLKVPAKKVDHHTPGDAGTTSLALSAGLVPLEVNFKGEVIVSRHITSLRSDAAIEDYAYFDVEDWKVMYFFRKNAYAIARQDRYVRTKNSDTTVKNLMSELIALAKDFEAQGMLQKVDQFADQFKIERPTNNRSAAVFRIPMNVVPGLHNIGIDVVGTDQFDVFEL